MELLFAAVIAAGIGAVIRYVVPGREAHGILLLPAVACAVTCAVWVALVWLGWTFDGGWIWVVGLTAGGVAALLVAFLLPRGRRERDEELFAKLSRG